VTAAAAIAAAGIAITAAVAALIIGGTLRILGYQRCCRANRTRQDRPRAVFRPLPISRVPPGRKTAHRASQGVPPRSRAPLSDRDITAAIRALPADDVAALLGDRGRAKLLTAARLAKRAPGEI
jgi:hypothetical protein